MKLLHIFLITLALLCHGLPMQAQTQSSQVTKKFNEESEDDQESSFLDDITSKLDTPVLRNGLEAGTKAINRSIENLMDALFYQIMDNEWTLAKKDNLSLKLETERTIYDAPNGDYVVADRVSIGPTFERDLGLVKKIPVSLAAGINADYYEIYPRSEVVRLTEAEQDNLFSWSAKNWFGVLPLLTRVLPPSFRPNELYDPLRLISPPASIPLNKEQFETMPLNSIRSYAISGGINIPFILDQLVDPKIKSKIASLEGLSLTIPYSVFINGEYRINVLRKDNKTAWVGLTNSSSIGNGVFGIVGKTIYVLKDFSPRFAFGGMPLPLFPIDSDVTSNLTNSTNVLYEFDLTTKEGNEAYEKAVIGDFDYAFRRAQRKAKGVTYHFTKNDHIIESHSKQKVELGLFSKAEQRKTTDTDSAIRDKKGKFFVLETKENMELRDWDILVGESSTEFQTRLTLHVSRIDASDDGSDWMYKYKNIKNPWLFSVKARISDNFTSALELDRYKDMIEGMSSLKLWGFPDFTSTHESTEDAYNKNQLTAHPYDRIQNFTPQPKLLGKFIANLEVLLSTEQLKNLYKNARSKFRKNYKEILFRDAPLMSTHSDSYFALYPTRFINLLFSPLRAIGVSRVLESRLAELNYRTELLQDLANTDSPKEHQEIFSELFETDYPTELTSALVKSAADLGSPRIVTLKTKPAKGLSPGDNLSFSKLNKLKYRNGKSFDYWDRYNVTSQKANAFKPNQLTKKRKLSILAATIQTNFREVKKGNDLPFQLKFNIKGFSQATREVNLYIRFENDGKLDLGRLILSQSVQNLRVGVLKNNLREGTIVVNLHDNNDVKSFLLERMVQFGSNIRMTVGLSDKEGNWSAVRQLVFNYDNQKNKLTLLE